MKKTAKYYKNNKEAREKKNEYQKKYNKSEEQVERRVELNRFNRQMGTYGNGDDMDASHMAGKIVFEKAARNRARREKSRLKGSKRK
jgi:hypothetical protein